MAGGTSQHPRVNISDLLHTIRILHADFALFDFGPRQGYQLCNRDAIQIHLVLEGTLSFDFIDLKEALIVSAGEYLFAPRGLRHRIGASTAEKFTPLTYFDTPRNADSPPHIPATPPAIATLLSGAIEIDPTRHEALIRLVPELRVHRRHRGPTIFSAASLLHVAGLSALPSEIGSSAIFHVTAEMLLANATRLTLLPGASPAEGIATPDVPQLSVALRLIHEHPERVWSVASLARETGMSRTIFAAAFQARLGETPIRYLKAVRMARAQSLLREGGRALPEIARLSGYESEAAFARAFKREFGASPGRYRRAARDDGQD